MGRLFTFGLWGTVSLVFVTSSLLSFIGMLISGDAEGGVIVMMFCLFAAGGSMLITLVSEIYLIKSEALTEHQKYLLNNIHPVTGYDFLAYFGIVRALLKEKKALTDRFNLKLLYWLNKYFILAYIAVCMSFVLEAVGMYLYQ